MPPHVCRGVGQGHGYEVGPGRPISGLEGGKQGKEEGNETEGGGRRRVMLRDVCVCSRTAKVQCVCVYVCLAGQWQGLEQTCMCMHVAGQEKCCVCTCESVHVFSQALAMPGINMCVQAAGQRKSHMCACHWGNT